MPNVALCFSSGFLQEGTCQLGQVEQHESVNLMTHPLLGYLIQIENEAFQNWWGIWLHYVRVLCLRVLSKKSTEVNLCFSACTPRKQSGGACECVFTCLCMFQVFSCHHVRETCMGLPLRCQCLCPTGGNTGQKLSMCWFRVVQVHQHSHDFSLWMSMILIIFSQDWRVVKW